MRCHAIPFTTALSIKDEFTLSMPSNEVLGNKPLPLECVGSDFLPKPVYKSYLQRMKHGAAQAEKVCKEQSKKKKAMKGNKGDKMLSESAYDHDVDIRVRLTPGGTLRIQTHVEDDNYFWQDEYDEESAEEVI